MPTDKISLDYIYETMNLELPKAATDLTQYSDASSLYEHSQSDRIGAGLRVFIRSIIESATSVDKIDRSMIDAQVAFIDKTISAQLDEITHSVAFQQLESSWRSLKFLVSRTDFKKNVKIELLNSSKQDIMEDFEDSPETINVVCTAMSTRTNTILRVVNPMRH